MRSVDSEIIVQGLRERDAQTWPEEHMRVDSETIVQGLKAAVRALAACFLL